MIVGSEWIDPSPDRTYDPDPVDDGEYYDPVVRGCYGPALRAKDPCAPERRNVHANIQKLIKFDVVQARVTQKEENRLYDLLVDAYEARGRDIQTLTADVEALEQERDAAEAAYEHRKSTYISDVTSH